MNDNQQLMSALSERARSLAVSLGGEERRRGSMRDLALALSFVLTLALTIAAIYVVATS
jgi:thiol:disulfide interchange protein